MNANNEQSIIERLEDSINQGLQEAQTKVEDAKEKVGKVSTGTSVASGFFEITKNDITKSITHTIHIFTSKLKNILEAAEITLEYINTGDSIKIVGRVA